MIPSVIYQIYISLEDIFINFNFIKMLWLLFPSLFFLVFSSFSQDILKKKKITIYIFILPWKDSYNVFFACIRSKCKNILKVSTEFDFFGMFWRKFLCTSFFYIFHLDWEFESIFGRLVNLLGLIKDNFKISLINRRLLQNS